MKIDALDDETDDLEDAIEHSPTRRAALQASTAPWRTAWTRWTTSWRIWRTISSTGWGLTTDSWVLSKGAGPPW